MPHPTYEIHSVCGLGIEEPFTCCERLGPWGLPSRHFRATLSLIEWSCVDVPVLTSVRWSERHVQQQLETLAGHRIRSVDILERTPCAEELLPLLDEDHRFGSIVVDILLDEPLPPAFTPYRAFPKKGGELTFEAIVERLLESEPVRVSGVHEAEHWWAFGRSRIGSCGFAVARADGSVTDFGSAFPWETWIWAHERGLLAKEPLDFVIDSVMDHEAACALVAELGLASPSESRARLATFPAVSAFDWRWIGVLRDRAHDAIQWTTRPAAVER